MGERKVLNKYFPPDFDPTQLPKGKRGQNNEKKVRMMLPMSVRCSTCGNFMYKGTKFNTRMEDVAGETYLGLRIFRFYYRCTACAGEFCMKTDPKTTDYILEGGASRNYEPWRDQDVAKQEAARAREEEEMGNAMKALENRTLDSKREMDIMAALDEVQTLNARHNKVTTEDALAALQREAERAAPDLQQEEMDDLAEFYQLRQRQQQRQQQEEASSPSSGEEEGVGGAGKGGLAGKRGRSAAGADGGPGSSASAAGKQLPTAAAAAAEKELQGLPEKPGPSASSKAAPAKPVFKVVAKPKVVAAAAPAAAAPKPSAAPGGAGSKSVSGQGEEEEGDGGGLAGLLGGYGSSDGSGSP